MEIQLHGKLTKIVNEQNVTKDTLLWEFILNKVADPGSEAVGATTESASKIPPEDYLEAIRTLHPKFEQDKVYQEDNTIFLFIGEDLTRIPGTEFPNCISSNVTYVMEYFTKREDAKVNFRGEARQAEGIVISFQSLKDASQGSIRHYTSQPFGPFEQGADFFISVDGGPVKNFSFNACSAAYHVSISAGFFGSSLNNPENITQTVDDGTLYADNQTSQKAITIMALFYPIPRDPFYRYKELNFWQKWSFSFGTKLSDELFKDFY
ncbi:hypothetical protein [Dyadobacter crusticola]|uniref:hypothetical protein n=1 Tax=Dyadobacter crusticola TaxID=292407 RepID=UPI0004E28BBD|nr:hypothetical protein [Dyadobacter crusticola]